MKKTLEHYERYGWKCNEDNLSTLPVTAPESVKDLAKWLTLEGRRSSLVELLQCVSEDGRIHGKFWNIGAWTHRMSHSAPNQANIPSVFDDDPKTAVEEVKARYNGRIRECFKVPEDSWLVGTDAESIQLRVLAHYLKSEPYRKAIVEGKKEDETDIHNLNRRSLGGGTVTRDIAKTFIYAWLLGAGTDKVASILGCTHGTAKSRVEGFIKSTDGLDTLRRTTIPRDARRGYFIGLDGRIVKCSSEHLMLAGYLQNGEAVIMKRALVLWHKWATAEGLDFKLVDFVHDEWQTEVKGDYSDAERIGHLQCLALEQVCKDLNLFCPLVGSTSIGKNWKETH